jgi:hypothetical protein
LMVSWCPHQLARWWSMTSHRRDVGWLPSERQRQCNWLCYLTYEIKTMFSVNLLHMVCNSGCILTTHLRWLYSDFNCNNMSFRVCNVAMLGFFVLCECSPVENEAIVTMIVQFCARKMF